ncbi:MAG: adenylate/guanylate cyclase domain-containing protein [Planctomycetota bacterium]
MQRVHRSTTQTIGERSLEAQTQTHPHAAPADQPSAADLEHRLAIINALDAAIEVCRRNRAPLHVAIAHLLPPICELIGASGALVRALNEHLEWSTFHHGLFATELEQAIPIELPEEIDHADHMILEQAGGTLVCRLLDCAGMVVGVLGLAFVPAPDPARLPAILAEVVVAAEQLDNYLEGIATSARKHRISVSSSAALRQPILETGIDEAVRTLAAELDLCEVLLVFGDDRRGVDLTYRHYLDGKLVAASLEKNVHPALEVVLCAHGESVLLPDDEALIDVVGPEHTAASPLISGLSSAPIGKIVVKSSRSGLDPEGLNILHLFAECLCQRLVDYNRERRTLSRTFAPRDVRRLLREPNRFTRFLSPRVEEVAMVFSDVSSFTKICERVLGDASEIGELINAWSIGAIKAQLDNRGVFDKLVGDCVIGLFGPPFFESELAARAHDAVLAAVAVTRFTRQLGDDLNLNARLLEAGITQGLGAATGVNIGPASVGFFGPTVDFTCFSSAMNNAARLQGLANVHQVLVSERVYELAGQSLEATGLGFAGPFEGAVKNVQNALRYYEVLEKT